MVACLVGRLAGTGLEVRDAGPSQRGGSNADESHIYLEDTFGKIQLSSLESARQKKVTFAPNGASNFGVNLPFFNFAKNS